MSGPQTSRRPHRDPACFSGRRGPGEAAGGEAAGGGDRPGNDRVPLGPSPPRPRFVSWGNPPNPGGDGGGGGAAGSGQATPLCPPPKYLPGPAAAELRALRASARWGGAGGAGPPPPPLLHPISSTPPAWGLQGVSGYRLHSAPPPRATLVELANHHLSQALPASRGSSNPSARGARLVSPSQRLENSHPQACLQCCFREARSDSRC